jgi:hypothetical protein
VEKDQLSIFGHPPSTRCVARSGLDQIDGSLGGVDEEGQ